MAGWSGGVRGTAAAQKFYPDLQAGGSCWCRCAPVGPQAWLERERLGWAARCGGAQHSFVLRGGKIRAQCEVDAAGAAAVLRPGH